MANKVFSSSQFRHKSELSPSVLDQVDHTAAIKEYSRSSADQEEPLPHELRPLPVLSMTMDYLVTQIMDQSQDNYRDWYDFVWNRTRGIRKVQACSRWADLLKCVFKLNPCVKKKKKKRFVHSGD